MKSNGSKFSKLCTLLIGLIASSILVLAGTGAANSAQSSPPSNRPLQANSETDVLDNDAIIKMVQAKLSVTVIKNAIRDNPGRYSLTPNSLIRLNSAGVPEAVIEAMQTKAAVSAVATSGSGASANGSVTQPPFVGTNVSDARNSSTAAPYVLGGIPAPLNSELSIRVGPNKPSPGVTSGAQLLSALDNSMWIADGAPSDKQIYIIAGPCCGYSQALYHASRQLKGVQLRWIEEAPTQDPRCLGYVGEIAARPDPAILAEMYDTGDQPRQASIALRDNAIRWNGGVEKSVLDIVNFLAQRAKDDFEYPTIVWLSSDGVRVAVRPTNNAVTIAAVVASLVLRPEATNITPRSRSFISSSYQPQSISKTLFLAKREGLAMYAFPDAQSQLVHTLHKDEGAYAFRRVTVAGEAWIELSLFGKGEPGPFVRESDVYPNR
jgi:hypothetical protein